MTTDSDFDDLTESDLADALGGEQQDPPASPPEGDRPERQPAEDPFPQSGDRPRDEQGRFKAKEEAPAGDGEGKAREGEEGQKAEPPLKEWQPLWWKEDQHGEWGKMPEALRQKLEERERESAQAITQHSTRAKEWEPVNQRFEETDPRTGRPYTEQLEQAGISKQDYINNLIQWDLNAREDPVGTVLAMCGNLGIDPAQLAEHAAAAGQQGGGQADPQLMRELQALRQEVSTLKNGRSDEDRQQQFRQIAEWAKDKPYFEELRPMMAALAKADPEATLDEIYERAQYAHPTLRDRILRDQRKRDADRARQAGVSTRGAPRGPAPAPNARLSLEEELGAGYDEIMSGAV